MVNKKIWLGILVLVFGMTFVGCDILEEKPKDEIELNGHRYKRIDQIKSWTDAKIYCEGKDGHLATITSAEEQSAIEKIIVDGDKKAYWLGGYRDINNKFVWITNEVMNYTNWGDGEPDTFGAGQDKISIYREPHSGWNWSVNFGEWDDEADSVGTNGFIIEWD